jgi:hypothetical protein
MSRAFATLLVVVVAAFGVAPAGAAVAVTVDRTEISTTLGHKFVFHSTITNPGSTPLADAIAHLNILSLRDGVYVDPEDWSSNRTRYLGTIPAGGSRTITWRMQAVNAGTFGVYVAALPAGGATARPITSPTVRLSIAERTTLNSGGILPLAIGIPALLAALSLGIRFRRAR